MLVSGVSSSSWDLKWLLQFVFSAFVLAMGLHALVKNTASKYFEVDATFEGEQHQHQRHDAMPGLLMDDSVCAVCRNPGSKKCSRCKSVRYCSQACQQAHWKSEHKMSCKEFQKQGVSQTGLINRGFKASAAVNRSTTSIALIPECGRGISRPIKQLKDVLFPYDDFVNLFNWDKPGFPPCGLLNCGNSCFANVVLQCLSFTRPLIAYLLEKGHRSECCHNDWCFLCEFETHVEKVRLSSKAFSPMNILSRLPNIGGTLGYGRQEDAHEFMRFSIDAMQSVCLDEFGGEKAVPPKLQETTLIQHIFGGHLQSEVICTECEKNSNQYENMMDLTVEIHGDAASLEECLDQFTAKEWLHGDNMYKCDGCKGYVKAWKRLTVKRAPNILTIALKRFQSGRFGKLNKRVAFPETLDLSPYTSEVGDGSDIYKLYAVVVHIDMLNASFFGHYICYIKDFSGNWYRIDDWKVVGVELEEVLSQSAYMLLYSRVHARASGLQTIVSSETTEVQPSSTEHAEGLPESRTETNSGGCESSPSNSSPEFMVPCENMPLSEINSGVKREQSKDVEIIEVNGNDSVCNGVESSYMHGSEADRDMVDVEDSDGSNTCSSVLEEISVCMEEQDDSDLTNSSCPSSLPNKYSSVSVDYENAREDSDSKQPVDTIKSIVTANGFADHSNGYVSANKYDDVPVEDGDDYFLTETTTSDKYEDDKGNRVKEVEI
ncbi:ubiquitin carboxyl-terminal hydrolase 18-like [Vigna umbellata]|uniref:ubiquitin carboxyl-terminal hydrolase 18-like n=1 Tax=Vigna umbellata TaxID=87088 RepID=UPI001F5F529C|nr:ubiquitin carboxyl-terminal hydrolase 18-like [Vigna umbellata]